MADDSTNTHRWDAPPQNGTDYTYSEVDLPFWAYLLGATQSQVKTTCQLMVRNLNNVGLPRPVTQEEFDAILDQSRRTVSLKVST